MNNKSAWIYCRIDAPEDTHGALKGQYEKLETYAAQMSFDIVGSSQDLGSGLNCQRRFEIVRKRRTKYVGFRRQGWM